MQVKFRGRAEYTVPGCRVRDETGWNRVEICEVRWDTRLGAPAGLSHDGPGESIKAEERIGQSRIQGGLQPALSIFCFL